MPKLENREIARPGQTLVATYKGKQYTCRTSVGEDGRVVFTMEDGRTFTSPSAAGKAITGTGSGRSPRSRRRRPREAWRWKSRRGPGRPHIPAEW